jgi:hypothetical protein
MYVTDLPPDEIDPSKISMIPDFFTKFDLYDLINELHNQGLYDFHIKFRHCGNDRRVFINFSLGYEDVFQFKNKEYYTRLLVRFEPEEIEDFREIVHWLVDFDHHLNEVYVLK